MLMTRCRCKRVLLADFSQAADPRIYKVALFREMLLPMTYHHPTTDSSDRRFEHRGEYDKETRLPIYFEEGYYA